MGSLGASDGETKRRKCPLCNNLPAEFVELVLRAYLLLKEGSTAGARRLSSSTIQGRVTMLVLSRRVGEEIIINDNIRVTVVAVKGDRVRLGIVAPRDVTVDRSEVHARRAQFGGTRVPVGAPTDADVPLGVLPAKHPDDTLVH